jgi:hypothetical protein
VIAWCQRARFFAAETVATIVILSGLLAACSVFTRDNAQKMLRAADIACILASALTDSDAVMQACQVERELRPVVDQLLSQKRAAQRASLCAPDAGPRCDGGPCL